MRLRPIDLENVSSDDDLEKRLPVEIMNTSGSFSSRTSSEPLNSEKNESAQRLLVPSNTVASAMFERIRGAQRLVKNEYVEVYTSDDDSDNESAGKVKKLKMFDTSDVNGDRSLAFEVFLYTTLCLFYSLVYTFM